MSALKSHVKYELSTLTNKTEMMLLNLLKTANAQQENVNKNVELLQQNIHYLDYLWIFSENKTIKTLLEVQSVLIETINKSTLNSSECPDLQ